MNLVILTLALSDCLRKKAPTGPPPPRDLLHLRCRTHSRPPGVVYSAHLARGQSDRHQLKRPEVSRVI